MLVMLAAPAVGQLTVGDDTKLNLAGWVGFGYNGTYGSTFTSGHSTSVIGDVTLNGSYYNPNFLSFIVHPYYDRNQTNDVTGNTTNTSGFESSVNLFSGSHFPGAVSYSRQFTSAGEYGIPGSSLLSTDGSSQNFTVSWSALVPNYPTLSVNYSLFSNSATVVGATTESSTSGQNFNLNSTYLMHGFNLMGFLNHQSLSLSLPDFVNPNLTSNETSSTSYGVSAVHRLPMQGSFSASWNHTHYSGNNDASDGNGFNNVNVGATILPTHRLTLSSNVNYVDNVSGLLQQQLVTGGVFEPVLVHTATQGVTVDNQAYYTLGHGFGLSGFVNYLYQSFLSQSQSYLQYGGLVTYRYSKPILGMLYFNFGLANLSNDSDRSPATNNLAFTGSLGLNKNIGRWETEADVSYQQSVQSIEGYYTTSNFNYGGYVRRKLRDSLRWTSNFRGMHNGLTQQEGDSNRSESLGTSLGFRRITLSGYYSQAKGTSVLSLNGTLVPTPVAPVVTSNVVYYDGKSYSVSLATVPIKHFTLTGYYTSVKSQTQTSVFSFNNGERYSGLAEYQFRKMAFRGGFTHTRQDISAVTTLPATVNTYFFSIQRWFNIF